MATPITVDEMVTVVAKIQLSFIDGLPCNLSAREVGAIHMVLALSRREPTPQEGDPMMHVHDPNYPDVDPATGDEAETQESPCDEEEEAE